MSTARTVTLQDGRFHVTNDPNGALGCLLGFLASPALTDEAPAAQRFAADGPGLTVPDNLVAARAEPIDLAELPPEQVPADPSREWWVLYLDQPHGEPGPSAIMIIEGDELRDLLRAAGLWST